MARSIISTAEAPSPVAVIVRAGLVGGVVVDAFLIIMQVFVLHKTTVPGLYQYVASAILGPAAFNEGAGSVVLGVALHFAISIVWAAIYLYAARANRSMRNPLVGGVVLGIVVWLVMSFVVVPLSATPKMPGAVTAVTIVMGLISHVLFFGLPVSYTTRSATTG